jgi:hypothetical protein
MHTAASAVSSQASSAIEIHNDDDTPAPTKKNEKPPPASANVKASGVAKQKQAARSDGEAMIVDTAPALPAPSAPLALLAGRSNPPSLSLSDWSSSVVPSRELDASTEGRTVRRTLASTSAIDMAIKFEVAAAITLLTRSVVTAELWRALHRVPSPNEVLACTATAGATMLSDPHPDSAATGTARQWREDARTYQDAMSRALQEVRAVEGIPGLVELADQHRAALGQFTWTLHADEEPSAEASLKRVRAESTGQAAPQASSSSVALAPARKRPKRDLL